MENKGVSIFEIVSKGDVVVGSMLDELIRAVENSNFNPATPIFRVVNFCPIRGEIAMDVAGAVLDMNNSRIDDADASHYLEYEKFQIYTAEWVAEMSVGGEWYGDHQGYADFSGRLEGWCVSEPDRDMDEVVPGFAKFGVPLSQPPLGRIGVVVRYHYIYEHYGTWCYSFYCGFEAFKYADNPDKAFKFRSEEPIELNKPQFRGGDFGMYVEESPDLRDEDVEAQLRATLTTINKGGE